MDVNSIYTAIGSLGFPIAMCIALFWYITRQNEKHKEEIDKLAEAINNNTTVMTTLLEEIRKEGK